MNSIIKQKRIIKQHYRNGKLITPHVTRHAFRVETEGDHKIPIPVCGCGCGNKRPVLWQMDTGEPDCPECMKEDS